VRAIISTLWTRVFAVGLTGLWLAAAPTSTQAEALTPGAKAPDFELLGSDGKLHSLAMHRGKRGVVLAWFPKAFTPG